jgi:tripartite-type tricarboxylate transporter receptor subunit TctC
MLARTALCAFVLITTASTTSAQSNWPTRPVSMVVPFAAGS